MVRLVLAALGLLAFLVPCATAGGTVLPQLPLPAGCVSQDGTGGLCGIGSPLTTPAAVVVSPDGTNVYATSYEGDAVLSFERRPDGSLVQIGCVSETGAGGCLDGYALDGPAGITIGPEGGFVYVAVAGDTPDTPAQDAVVAFRRQMDGTLAELSCVSEDGSGGLCADGYALEGASGIVASPDGFSLYVAAEDVANTGVSDSVVSFQRQMDGTMVEIGCTSETGTGGLCADGVALDGASGIAISPDGSNVYVASGGLPAPGESNAVAIFHRDPGLNASIPLTQIGCVSEDGTGGACADGAGLVGAGSVAVAPDGSDVIVASLGSGALAVLARGAGGLLSPSSCVSVDGTGGQCESVGSLSGAAGVGFFSDGRTVVATGRQAGSVSFFDRAGGGALTFAGCTSEDGTAGLCADGTALAGANGIAVGAGGRSVYATALFSSAIAVFEASDGGPGPVGVACVRPEALPSPCAAPGEDDGGSAPPWAPPADAGGGPASGQARMPDLSASVDAVAVPGGVRVVLRVRIARPGLARPFAVRLAIPALGAFRTVRIAPRARAQIVRVVVIPVAEARGRLLTAIVDPGRRVAEARERNNSASTRIR